jgi:hypothetical protein
MLQPMYKRGMRGVRTVACRPSGALEGEANATTSAASSGNSAAASEPISV